VWADGGKAVIYIHEDAILYRELGAAADRELYRGAGLHELAISSDGQWLAFVSTSEERDALLAIEVGQAIRLTRRLASVPKNGISGVEWTRDNGHLLVSTPSKPVAGLWRVSLEGGQPERLPVAIDRQGGVRLHPDGRRVAFTRGAVQSEVWRMDLTSLLAPRR
jgi:dipeptidyl aminopeptidase/acylaminoacyl peptidase